LFLEGLYSIAAQNEESAEIILSDASHPVFQAHFPDNPILPGFIHLEIIALLFALEINGIKKAKFSSFVKPKERLLYRKEANKIRVFCEDREIALFQL
jgi:3-hydroxyacyl-[acyl-carrier-protein] dehydratase